MLVTLESTTYPGTTEEIVQPILETSGLKVGDGLSLAFSPERVDPGNAVYQTRNTPKVVGGVTPRCTEEAVAFYGRFIDTIVPVSSTRAAEMTKLLENIFRCVNIALMNELLQISERMGINIWEVVDAAKTKPFGFMPFQPGPGSAGTASRSTRSTSRGRRASSTCIPSSSNSPARPTRRCPTTWCSA